MHRLGSVLFHAVTKREERGRERKKKETFPCAVGFFLKNFNHFVAILR